MVYIEIKRNRGGQLGNQNARKHGFYSRSLTHIQKHDLKKATSVEGVDEEIAIVRVKLKSILAHDADNVRLINIAVSSLVRLLRFKYKYHKNDRENLQQAFENVIRDVALPIGVDITRQIFKLPKPPG
jgi:hypothetical protein